jgi:hypothetical protein
VPAAQCQANVTLLDERSALGGQYFKQPAKGLDLHGAVDLDPQARAGRDLVEVERPRRNDRAGCNRVGRVRPRRSGVDRRRAAVFAARQLILALGRTNEGADP